MSSNGQGHCKEAGFLTLLVRAILVGDDCGSCLNYRRHACVSPRWVASRDVGGDGCIVRVPGNTHEYGSSRLCKECNGAVKRLIYVSLACVVLKHAKTCQDWSSGSMQSMTKPRKPSHSWCSSRETLLCPLLYRYNVLLLQQ